MRTFFGFIAFGLAATAWGQPSLYPPLVKIGALAGSTVPVTDVVTLTTSGNAGSYDLAIRYDSSAQGWLSATPSQGTTPSTLTLTADPTNLLPGTYSAQVVASVGPTHLGAWTTVSFIVAPGTSNPGGVAASPSNLTFQAQSLSAQTISVYDAPGTTGVLNFSVFANPSTWLTVTTSGLTTPGQIKVLPIVAGMHGGTHTGTVTITTPAGKSTVVPVTVGVPDSFSGPTIVLTPGQRALTFNYQLNTTVNPQQTVYVSTDSTQYTNFTATASASWIGVASAAYATPAASAQCFAPGLFYVSVDPTGLTLGTYKGTITLSAPGATSADIPVTLTVSGSPVLNSSPSFAWMDTSANVLSSNLAITGSSALFFTATASAPWLSVSPSSGIAIASATNVTATASIAGLSPGTYAANITLTASGGNLVQIIPVELHIVGDATASTLASQPTTVAFSGISGIDSIPQFVLISAGANDANLRVTIAASSDSGWLSVAPSSGTTPLMVKVSANSAVAGGLYTGSVIATDIATGDQTTVTASYKVTARALSATPGTLTFVQQSVGAALSPQEVQIAANAPSTFRIASQPAWAKIVTPAVLTTPSKLTVSVDPAGLAPGQYQDNIVLSGPNDVAVPVALTIAAPAPPAVTPKSLTFQYELGSPPPSAQSLQVASPSGALPFTALASTVSGINWLNLNPASGSAPATLAVTVAVDKLVPGQHSGSIVVTLQNSAASTFTVPVTLTVSGSIVQLQNVFSAAALTPGSLAPGEIVTLTGFGLGPSAPVSSRPSTAGAYPVSLAGTVVTFDGTAAPLLMAQDGQINAIVPYSVNGRATTKVQVQSASGYSVPIDFKVVDAAPGIFTSGSSGRGQAAALNADSTPNSVLNPAQRGSVVVLYMTGEGQTDPPGQDGRVIATDVRTPLLPVTARIGGQPADVLYAGSGPTLVSGLCQVNLRVPDTIAAGTQAVEILVGVASSQRGVTIEVR